MHTHFCPFLRYLHNGSSSRIQCKTYMAIECPDCIVFIAVKYTFLCLTNYGARIEMSKRTFFTGYCSESELRCTYIVCRIGNSNQLSAWPMPKSSVEYHAIVWAVLEIITLKIFTIFEKESNILWQKSMPYTNNDVLLTIFGIFHITLMHSVLSQSVDEVYSISHKSI